MVFQLHKKRTTQFIHWLFKLQHFLVYAQCWLRWPSHQCPDVWHTSLTFWWILLPWGPSTFSVGTQRKPYPSFLPPTHSPSILAYFLVFRAQSWLTFWSPHLIALLGNFSDVTPIQYFPKLLFSYFHFYEFSLSSHYSLI